jgi:hypothetical protein
VKYQNQFGQCLEKALPRDQFLNIGLRLMQQLLAAIRGAGQLRNEVTSLQCHMKLKLGDILAEVFPMGGVGQLL